MLKKLNELLTEKNIDALWVTNEYNKRYLTNFSGTTSEVVVTKEKIIFITDGRYQTQVKTEIYEGIDIHITTSSVSYMETLTNIIKDYEKIGVESNHLSIERFNTFKKELSDKEFSYLNGEIEKLRIVKDEAEIEKTIRAVEITDKTFLDVVKYIKPGMTEIEVQLYADNRHILNGADKASFDTILVAGENSAKPHGKASNRVINDGDIVTLDFGCYKDGYVSDMTRTFFVGKPRDEELVKIHQIVLEAHEAQIKAIRPGIIANEIDKIGRDIISSAGYGDKFIHGTGHGIGLEIHEEPYVNMSSQTILQEGMLITIEPGIYIEGLGGVRIEQDVLVTKDGYVELNKSYKGYDVIEKVGV